MNKTKIEWVKNPDGSQGYTWNPITGCLNGCEYCYARKLANTRLKERYLANDNLAPTLPNFRLEMHTASEWLDPFYPRFWEDRVTQMALYTGLGKLRGIFVCDMSDLFGIGIPEEWTRKVLDAIKLNCRHRFYLLTKQPQNLIKFSPFPDNCWVGVSITNEHQAVEAVTPLIKVEAKTKFISFEPLLGRIRWQDLSFVNWVIIGAQTKPYKPPKIEWVIEIIEACAKAGIPVFMKDNLKPIAGRFDLKQEMPR